MGVNFTASKRPDSDTFTTLHSDTKKDAALTASSFSAFADYARNASDSFKHFLHFLD